MNDTKQLDLTSRFLRARLVGTPLIGVSTPDPALTIQVLIAVGNTDTFRVKWDCVSGIVPIGDHSVKVLHEVVEAMNSQVPSDEPKLSYDDFISASVNPIFVLDTARKFFPKRALMFMLNAHRFLDERDFVQALWNCREPFKNSLRSCVLLAPSFNLRPELVNDIVLMDEALPDDDMLDAKVTDMATRAKLSNVTGQVKTKCVDAMRGLPLFASEQALATSIDTNGSTFDTSALWELKRLMIEQIPGLKVNRDGIAASSLVGHDQIINFFTNLFNGKNAPALIVRIDEIEKVMSGAKTDTSGVSGDALSVVLREMEDNGYRGLIANGFPGTGKSALSKAIGNLGGVPTIEIDMGAMKGSLVGQSEQMVRSAFKVIKSLGGKNVFFIATCNDMTSLPPELIRRFPYGKWFFDLLTDDQATSALEVYGGQYSVSTKDAPDMTDWTGAEVKMMCEIASKLDITIKDAVQYIVPFHTAERELVTRMRAAASGKFLSTSKPGPYVNYGLSATVASDNGRVFDNSPIDDDFMKE